jgi:transposase
LKSSVLKSHFYEPEYQRDYFLFSQHYGFSPSPSRDRIPIDNAQAECRIKYVKRNFFQGRKFRNIDSCNRKLREWMESISHQRIHGTTITNGKIKYPKMGKKMTHFFCSGLALLKAIPSY